MEGKGKERKEIMNTQSKTIIQTNVREEDEREVEVGS